MDEADLFAGSWDRFLSDAHVSLWSGVDKRRSMQALGFNLVPADFYSSIPTISDLDATFESDNGKPIPIYSEVFDPIAIKAYVDHLLPYAAELVCPDFDDENKCKGFFWNNTQFTNSDAVAYYCMLRHIKPARVVEIGSGFSTLVADAALRKNGFGEIVSIEPHPRPFLPEIATLNTILTRPIQNIAKDAFLTLMDTSEVLFIDSTHTVKIGSDCLYIYLHLLPALTKRVMVHSHDIFLPFGMPVDWARERHIYWTEQYLLYAFLLKNPDASVVYGSTYLAEMMPDVARAVLGSRGSIGGGSLWYELNGNSSRVG